RLRAPRTLAGPRRRARRAVRGWRAAAARSTRAEVAARATHSLLARYPDLLCGPLPRPVRSDVVVVAVTLGICRRLQLVQGLDLEAGRAQMADPLAVRQVVLDADLARPLRLEQAEERTLQLLGDLP